MHHTDTVRIATNPRKWRRPAPCPACPNCRHKCILHVDGRSLNKAIRLWNHHASHHQRNEQ